MSRSALEDLETIKKPYIHCDDINEFLYIYTPEIVNIERTLKEYKQIEEELGIDLITLFKALKNGVYYFTNGNQLTKDYVYLSDNYINIGTHDKLSYSFMTAFGRETLLFKDYGKTWALTKKEL